MPVKLEDLVYPDELTNAHWQKAKGKLGKTVKTGLGPELAKAEALFKRVNLNLIDMERSALASEEDLENRIKIARTEHALRILPVVEQWKMISVAATTAQHDLNKNLLGKTAAKEAGKISKAALRHAEAWSRLDLTAPVARLTVAIQRAKSRAKDNTEKRALELAGAMRTFMAAPSVDRWDGDVHAAITKLESDIRTDDILNKRYGRQLGAMLALKSARLGFSAQSTPEEMLAATRDAMKTIITTTKELMK